MTSSTDQEPALPREPSSGRQRGSERRRIDPRDIASICPYLVADDGAWRTAHPSREHRCAAVHPPAPIGFEMQRETCLTASHAACPAYLAIRRAGAPESLGETAPALWPIARTSPVLLETPGLRLGALPVLAGRPGGQVILGALMVLAFVAVVISRTVDPGGGAASPTPSAIVSPSPSPTVRATPRPTPSPSASADASASPSAEVSATPEAAASGEVAGTRQYRVRAGDTLVGIASEFDTTVRALMDANGIDDPSELRIGQRLTIPG